MKALVANAVLFQLCWIAFVAGAGHGNGWLGFAVLVPFALWQVAVSRQPRTDLVLVAVAALLGLALDSSLQATGLLQFAAPGPWTALAPAWIVGLWIGFALTLNHSLAFLQRRFALAAAFGAIGAPVAYGVAAHALSAATLIEPAWRAYLALGVAWAAATPLLARLAARLAAAERRAGGEVA
jgi:hypothetical protein